MPRSTTTTMSISLLSSVRATWLLSRTGMTKEAVRLTTTIMKAKISGNRNRHLINPTVLASIQQWMEVGAPRHLSPSTQQNWKHTTPGRATIIKVSKSAPIIQIMHMWKEMREVHRSKRIQGHKPILLVTTQIRSQAICSSRHTPRMDLVAHFCQVQIRPH